MAINDNKDEYCDNRDRSKFKQEIDEPNLISESCFLKRNSDSLSQIRALMLLSLLFVLEEDYLRVKRLEERIL